MSKEELESEIVIIKNELESEYKEKIRELKQKVLTLEGQAHVNRKVLPSQAQQIEKLRIEKQILQDLIIEAMHNE